MRPKVFLSKSFLAWLLEFREIPRNKILQQNLKDWKSFLEKFIFEECFVYLDVDENFIQKSEAIVNGIIKPQTDEEKTLAFGIYEMTRNNLIRFCKDEIEIFKAKNFRLFEQMTEKPDFLFLSNFYSDETCKEIADGFGIFCMNTNLRMDAKSINAQTVNIAQNEQFNFEKLFPYLPPINSAIIVDQYIFQNDNRGVFLLEMINRLRKNNLEICFHLTILHADDRTQMVTNILEKIKNTFTNIEITCKKLERFDNKHDRHILTNNYVITSGIGFKNKYPDGSTRLDYFPNGSYYQKNLETLKLKTRNLKLENRLCVPDTNLQRGG